MDRTAPIYVAGMTTLVGAALVRVLRRDGYVNLVGIGEEEPDLTDGAAVDAFMGRARPAYVFVAGGPSAGIRGNVKRPASLMRDNLLVETHVINSAYRHGATKLVYLASSCCYPRACPQPMQVTSLMTGPLEPTNQAYALAKLAGIVLCRAYADEYGARFVAAIPGDAFGPGDDFDPEDAHVMPALIRRMHEARMAGSASVEIWGTGRPRREFVFADDVADGAVFLMRRYEGADPINLGGGAALSVGEVAGLIRDVVGYRGDLHFDPSKPDGMPVKVLDSGPLLDLGWRPATPLRQAIQATYDWYVREEAHHDATRSSV